tara:strand:- start:2897 stop:4180 length:1284 start_codon:yes stop_codon:yes gene_type:complete
MREKIGIVGLGYIGIQLAVTFGKERDTIGFDPDRSKIDAYRSGVDTTGELTGADLAGAKRLTYTDNGEDLSGCGIFVVAVPTPVNETNQPEFSPLVAASRTVGSVLDQGGIVIYESTVYPGATEEICIPVLEEVSGLKWKQDFHVGYSPERINPGDPEHVLSTIVKVVAGDDEATLDRVATLYESVIPAGVHRASSIRVAEAAKVIENTQRDLNIALVNELALIFDRLGIDTQEVLEAAGSKWNFLPFKPGLVGGHCIGVDPYYLTHKAQMIGYEPQVILAGRRINDGMGLFVAEKIIELMAQSGVENDGGINLLGVTFKENCSDTRNSQVFDLVKYLQTNGINVSVCDPLADGGSVIQEQNIALIPIEQLEVAPVLIVAVPHRNFGSGQDLVRKFLPNQKTSLFIDVKSAYRDVAGENPRLTYWSL